MSLRRFGRGKQFVGVRLDLSKRMDGAGKVERVRKSSPVLVWDQQSRLLQDFKVVHHAERLSGKMSTKVFSSMDSPGSKSSRIVCRVPSPSAEKLQRWRPFLRQSVEVVCIHD